MGARFDEVPCQWAILGVFKVQDRFHRKALRSCRDRGFPSVVSADAVQRDTNLDSWVYGTTTHYPG
jgi:hypothetical protein